MKRNKIFSFIYLFISFVCVVIVFSFAYNMYQSKYNTKTAYDVVDSKYETYIEQEEYFTTRYYITTKNSGIFEVNMYDYFKIKENEIYKIRYYETLLDGNFAFSVQIEKNVNI